MIIDRNSPVPQYFQLQNWLIEQIEQGVFKENDKIPTEEELVKITGLARATIRQAFQNLVNMGYLVRKRRLGTFVLHRRTDRAGNTIVGVMVPDIRSGYAPELARGAGDEAAQSKHSLILCNTDDLFIKADYHTDRLIEQGVSGVIFVPTAAPDEKNRQIIEKFLHKNIPVVTADRQVPEMKVNSVTTDNVQGAYLLTNYLIRKGHRRIAVTLSTLFSTERDRLRGYTHAMTDAGLAVDERLIFTHNDHFSENLYTKMSRHIFEQRNEFSAIFAGHDRIAFLLHNVAGELGIRIPQDISLVGYDDLPVNYRHPLSLTTMHQPIYEMGKESMRLLLSRLHGNSSELQTIILPSHLVERDSVAVVAARY